MTSQAMEIIITIGIPAMFFMFIVGCVVADSKSQVGKLAEEKAAGKIDEFN